MFPPWEIVGYSVRARREVEEVKFISASTALYCQIKELEFNF